MELGTLWPGLSILDLQILQLGEARVTLASLIKLVVFSVLLVWGAGRLRSWFVGHGLRRFDMDLGTRQAVGSVLRYLVLIMGFALILQNAGIRLTALGVVAGALGVGVGFGLQNIISNFISGLIIMLERPIKVGDRVEVAGVEGTVSEIGARHTTVVTLDNAAILIPNQKFITDNVVNLVYTRAPLRLRVPVHVEKNTDVPTMHALLLQAAAAHPQILKEPGPAVLTTSLGGTAMVFELAVWFDAAGPTRQQLGSDLNKEIAAALQAQGIKNA